ITIAPPRESSQFKGSVAWKCAQHPGSRRPRTPAGRRVLRAWACLDQGLNFSSEDEEKVYGTLPVQNGKRMPGCRSLPKDPLARHISRWATTMGESPALQESTLYFSSTSPSSPPGIIPSGGLSRHQAPNIGEWRVLWRNELLATK
ncbi:Nuclear receptor coactivator 3, partial [Dissostichus eleginoides]